MKWIANTIDPKTPFCENSILAFPGQTQDEAIKGWREWLSDKIIGEPMETPQCTIAELKRSHMVGVYIKEQEKGTPIALTLTNAGPGAPVLTSAAQWEDDEPAQEKGE